VPEPKPDNYRVVCISMYVEDLAAVDNQIDQLKGRGIGVANRSALIRIALARLDYDNLTREDFKR